MTRGLPVALLVGVLVAAPPALAAVLLARASRGEPGVYLALLPATFVYLACLDLRFGVSGRLARRVRAGGRARSA